MSDIQLSDDAKSVLMGLTWDENQNIFIEPQGPIMELVVSGFISVRNFGFAINRMVIAVGFLNENGQNYVKKLLKQGDE